MKSALTQKLSAQIPKAFHQYGIAKKALNNLDRLTGYDIYIRDKYTLNKYKLLYVKV